MLTSNAPLKSQVYAKLPIGERNKTTILEMYGDFFFIVCDNDWKGYWFLLGEVQGG